MMLETSDYTIAQIAENVGYENALYFSRIFHKQTGISPKEYRKNFGNAMEDVTDEPVRLA